MSARNFINMRFCAKSVRLFTYNVLVVSIVRVTVFAQLEAPLKEAVEAADPVELRNPMKDWLAVAGDAKNKDLEKLLFLGSTSYGFFFEDAKLTNAVRLLIKKDLEYLYKGDVLVERIEITSGQEKIPWLHTRDNRQPVPELIHQEFGFLAEHNGKEKLKISKKLSNGYLESINLIEARHADIATLSALFIELSSIKTDAITEKNVDSLIKIISRKSIPAQEKADFVRKIVKDGLLPPSLLEINVEDFRGSRVLSAQFHLQAVEPKVSKPFPLFFVCDDGVWKLVAPEF